MAVLGAGGRLILRRDAPPACLVDPSGVSDAQNTIASICPGYWTGDRVSVFCLPVVTDGLPPNPSGYASYFGSSWFLGPNRTQVNGNDDAFYKEPAEDYPDTQFGDDAQFYAREGDIAGGVEIQPCTPNDYWIHLDPLGNVSFYESRCDAMQGCAQLRVDIARVAGSIALAPYGSLEYQNGIWECVLGLGEYQFSDAQDAVTLVSICEDPPLYQNPVAGVDEYDNANVEPRGRMQGQAAPYWEVMCEIQEWTLNLDAPSVDTTAISEKFGEAVKSIVTGGGSVDYLIDLKCQEDGHNDGTALMKLLLMTEKGCKASAKFYMLTGADGQCRPACGSRPGDLYYQADLLVTGTAVNLRPTEIVAGTANFATTGEIRLLEAH